MPGVRRIAGICIALVASYYGMSLTTIIVLGVTSLFVIFVLIPSIFHWCFTIQRHMIFLPWVKWPKLVDFDRPEDEGLEGTINFYLKSPDGARVGVWHVVPNSMIEESKGKDLQWFEETLSRGNPVVVYMHGNTGSRAREHRIEMYKVLRGVDFHVVCFDYRGYADSSPVIPTKRGVVTDAKTVLAHVSKYVNNSAPVVVWGHSLGTAVASQSLADLAQEGHGMPKALVLESPFNNIRDEIRVHPMTYLWRKMPWFDWFFTGSLAKSDVAFFTDECIKHIHIPILIMHAKDDVVVPFVLGERLFQNAKESRKNESKPIFFVPFEEHLGFGHVQIYSSPELPFFVRTFITKSIKDTWEASDYTSFRL